jgi:hypothetical protein
MPPAAAAEPAHLPVGEGRAAFHGLPPVPEGARRPVNPLQTSNLILEDEAPLRSFELDRGLTGLCRAGRFRQQREHLYVVRLAGTTYGAVIGGEWGLYDPAGLGVPGLVYALRYQDTGRCEVYVLRHVSAL